MIQISIQHPAVLAAGIVLAALAAFLFYRKDRKMDSIKKWILASMALLRFGSLALIFFLLSNPEIKRRKTSVEKPQAVILQDNSLSISNHYDSTYLSLHNKKIEKLRKALEEQYNTTIYIFDKNLRQQTPDYKGGLTNISKALQELKATYNGQNLQLVILLSDGIYNRGTDPLFAARNLPFSIYTVVMGDTAKHKDLYINALQANQYVYKGNKFETKINLGAYKAKGSISSLQIFFEGKNVYKTNLAITSNQFDTTITIEVPTSKAGEYRLKAIIQPLKGERNTDNNSYWRLVKVIDTKKKILIVSDFPHPDIAFIRRSVQNITGIETEYLTTRKLPKTLSQYSLIVVYQLPTLRNKANELYDQIKTNEQPFLLVTGTKTDYYQLSAYNTGIRVNIMSNSADETSPLYQNSFDLLEMSDKFIKLSSNLPPLMSPFGKIKITGDTAAIFTGKVKGIPTGKPLIVLFKNNSFNNNKSAVILGEGIWRWPLYEMRQTGQAEESYGFMRKIIQFLLADSRQDRFKVFYKKEILTSDKLAFEAQLYDMSYNPITNAKIKLVVKDSNGVSYQYNFERKNSSYFVETTAPPAGKYSFVATAESAQEKLKYTGVFWVRQNSIEKQQTRANYELLAALAMKNNGQVIFVDSIQNLPQKIFKMQNPQQIIRTTYNFEQLINFKAIAIIILLILASEWLLRKLAGRI